VHYPENLRVSPESPEATPSAPAPVASQGGLSHLFRALRHRNFRLFVAGQSVSLIGTFMQTVAQSWLVYRLTHSEWLLGVTWFCGQAPIFVLGPLGGLAADRYSRHRVVVATQTLSMLQALALAALTLTGRVQVWHVMALAVALGVVNAFDIPGRQSLLIQMTGKEDLLNAISLNSAMFNSARIVGPAVAGVLVAAIGEGRCFLVNGISFVAVIASLLAMRLPPFVPQAQNSPWIHLMEGFRYAHRTPVIRRLLMLVAAASVAGTPVVVLAPVFASDVFHVGAQGLGFLMGGMGAGAVVGTLVLARRTRTTGLGKVVFLGAVTLGCGLLIFALSRSFWLALLAAAPLVGFSVMRQNAAANTLIQVVIPDEYRGRIMSLYAMMVVGLGPFASLASGALADRIGVRWTVALGAMVALVAAIIFKVQARGEEC
jgi:MFS family permease